MSKDIDSMWKLLVCRMVKIDKEYRGIQQKREMFKLRRRMNSHHPLDHVQEETEGLVRHIAEVMSMLKEDFAGVKRDYLVYRNDFRTMAQGEDEVKYIEAIERCLDDDFEKEFFDE